MHAFNQPAALVIMQFHLLLFVSADFSQTDLTTHPKCRAPWSQPARDLGSHIVRSAGFGRQGLATNRATTLDPTDTQTFSYHGTASSPCLHHVTNYPQSNQLENYVSLLLSSCVLPLRVCSFGRPEKVFLFHVYIYIYNIQIVLYDVI